MIWGILLCDFIKMMENHLLLDECHAFNQMLKKYGSCHLTPPHGKPLPWWGS